MRKLKVAQRDRAVDALRRWREADPWDVDLYRRRYEEVLWEEDTSPVALMIKDAQREMVKLNEPFAPDRDGRSIYL